MNNRCCFVTIILMLIVNNVAAPYGSAQTVVFDTDIDAGQYYRIPTVVQLRDGSLLAIADDRHGSDADIGGNRGIDILGTVSRDSGTSWGTPVKIADGDGLNEGFNDSHGDAAAVVDRMTGRLLVMCASGAQGFLQSTLDNPLRVGRYTSDDHGLTWQESDVTSGIYGIFEGYPEVNALFFSSGRICQSSRIKQGDNYRIYSAVCGPTGVGSLVLYSDDFGQTWQALGGPGARPTASPWGDEAKVEELPNGNVLLSCRSKQTATNGRLFNIYDYATGSWGTMAVSNSPTRGTYSENCACNGELLIVPVMRCSDSCRMHLVLQSVPRGKGRQRVAIYYKPLAGEEDYDKPADFAMGWKPYLVTENYSAYSTMISLRDGSIAFFHEDCNDNNSTTVYDLLFQRLSIETITSGTYTSTPSFAPPILGDADGDGMICFGDVTCLIDLVLDRCSVEDHEAADVDGDSMLTIADVVALIDIIIFNHVA